MHVARLRPPGDRNGLLLVGISLLSGFGGALMQLAAGVWVLDLTGSSSLAALTGLCVFAPTLLGPVLGAAVDRFPRRRLLVWTQLGTAMIMLSLLAVRTEAQTWLIFAVMLGYGISFVLVDAGETALLPATLPREALGAVNGLRMSAQEGVKLIAPLVGAALLTWWGGYPVAVLTAVTLTAAAGLYALIRIRPVPFDPAPEPGPDSTGRIRDGIRFLWAHPELRLGVLVGSVTIAMSGFTMAALYAVVVEDLHRPAAFVGVLASAQGAGSMLGGVLVGRLLRVRGTRTVGALGTTLFAAGCLGRVLPWWPAAVVSAFVIGIGLPWTLVAAMTAVQTRTPAALLGRVAGTANTLLFTPIAVATPVGAALVLVQHHLPLLVAAVICLGTGLLAFRPGHRSEPAVAAGPGAEPDRRSDRAAAGR